MREEGYYWVTIGESTSRHIAQWDNDAWWFCGNPNPNYSPTTIIKVIGKVIEG